MKSCLQGFRKSFDPWQFRQKGWGSIENLLSELSEMSFDPWRFGLQAGGSRLSVTSAGTKPKTILMQPRSEASVSMTTIYFRTRRCPRSTTSIHSFLAHCSQFVIELGGAGWIAPDSPCCPAVRRRTEMTSLSDRVLCKGDIAKAGAEVVTLAEDNQEPNR